MSLSYSYRFFGISSRHADESLVDILKEHRERSILCEENNQIIVRRAKLLPTAFNAIKSPKFNCCKNLIVRFSGETGQDTGGPRREFFRYIRNICTAIYKKGGI